MRTQIWNVLTGMRSVNRSIPALTTVLVLIILWELVVEWQDTPRWLLPSPVDIGIAMIDSAGLLMTHAGISIIEMSLGFVIALSLGVLVAVLSHLSETIRRSIYPLLVISQSIPVIVLAPLLVIWFGFGIAPKIALIVLVCFFPICVSFLGGLQTADNEILTLLRAMGASRWQLFRIGTLPAALPALASGSKISATYAVIGAIIAEWLGASKGLGVFLIRSQNSFRADRAMAVIVIVSLIAIAAYLFIELLARYSMPWHYRQQGSKK